MERLKISWELCDPNDITASCVAGMHLRNERDLCAFAKCAKPMNGSGHKTFLYGTVCDECHRELEKFADQVAAEALEEILESHENSKDKLK